MKFHDSGYWKERVQRREILFPNESPVLHGESQVERKVQKKWTSERRSYGHFLIERNYRSRNSSIRVCRRCYDHLRQSTSENANPAVLFIFVRHIRKTDLMFASEALSLSRNRKTNAWTDKNEKRVPRNSYVIRQIETQHFSRFGDKRFSTVWQDKRTIRTAHAKQKSSVSANSI